MHILFLVIHKRHFKRTRYVLANFQLGFSIQCGSWQGLIALPSPLSKSYTNFLQVLSDMIIATFDGSAQATSYIYIRVSK